MAKSEYRVLVVTSEWPTPEHPEWVPFLVQQLKSLQAAGVEIEVFPFRGRKNPINYLKAWIRLRKSFMLDRFSLIHAHFGQSALLAFPKQIPLVVTFHGSDLQGYVGTDGHPTFSGKILSFISKWVARWADERIVVSEQLLEQLPETFSARIIPCGVDFERFRPIPQSDARKALGLCEKIPVVLFAANPDNPIKRFALARKAIQILKSSMDVELCTVTGISHEHMPLYLNAGDVLLLTSKHEGSPTIIKEALACNLPIVSVDVGDVRQRIGQVDGCVLCNDDSPETIASALEKVLHSRTRINGREAIKDLDERLLIEQIISVYQQVLSNPPP